MVNTQSKKEIKEGFKEGAKLVAQAKYVNGKQGVHNLYKKVNGKPWPN